MKQQTQPEDVRKFKRMGQIYAIMILVMGLSCVPLIEYLHTAGALIWAVIVVATFGYAFYVERWKNSHNLHTYREILAFMEGKPLEEIQSERQIKRELVIKMLLGAVVGLGLAVLGTLFFARSR